MSDTTETITVDATSTTTDATRQDEPLGEKGLKALNDERTARKEAERLLKEANDRLATIDREKDKADEDRKTKAGEFEQLAGERLTKLEETQKERDAIKSRADRATKLLEGQLTTRVEALKGTPLEAAYGEAFGDDADPLDRLAWLDDPRTVAALDAAKAGTTDRQAALRNAGGAAPKADERGHGAAAADQARHAQARRTASVV